LITRIQRGDDDDPYLAIVTQDALRGVLARWIEWYRVTPRGVEVPSLPPMYAVKDMMAAPEMPLPIIARIVEAPVFGADGELRLEPGFHPSSRAYFADGDLRVP